METFESWEVMLIAAAVGWFFYKCGKIAGRQKQRDCDTLKNQIDIETDPEKKNELQLKWAECIENDSAQKAFKAVVKARFKNKQESES